MLGIPIVWTTPTICLVCLRHHGPRRPRTPSNAARAQGIKVGMIRPITLWPFPKDVHFARPPSTCKCLPQSVEMNMGQMLEDVRAGHRLQPSGLPVQPGRRHDPCTGAGAGENFEIANDRRRKSMSIVFEKPKALTDAPLHYCPGCTHGIIHRLVAEAIDELWASRGSTIGIASGRLLGAWPITISTATWYEAAHGRAPAVATGVKRACPDNIVFTYQGDGDLAAIGTAETVHAAARRRKYHRHLRQQRHLRHDRRPDGSHHAARSGDPDLPLWPRCQRRLATPSRSARCSPQVDGAAYLERVAVNSVKHVNERQKGH